jgi:hypothetical protein
MSVSAPQGRGCAGRNGRPPAGPVHGTSAAGSCGFAHQSPRSQLDDHAAAADRHVRETPRVVAVDPPGQFAAAGARHRHSSCPGSHPYGLLLSRHLLDHDSAQLRERSLQDSEAHQDHPGASNGPSPPHRIRARADDHTEPQRDQRACRRCGLCSDGFAVRSVQVVLACSWQAGPPWGRSRVHRPGAPQSGNQRVRSCSTRSSSATTPLIWSSSALSRLSPGSGAKG